MDELLKPLEEKLGYAFKDRVLLKQALRTPGSISKKLMSYERLEFLGDRVLGLIVAELLYNRFTEERQGDLSKRFVALVRQETLVEVAQQIDLIYFVRKIGNIPEKDITPSVLSDVIEALMAAIFLDAGCEKATEIISKFWKPLIERDINPPRDAKTELQEWAQARNLGLPNYQVVAMQGAAHKPHFKVEVSLAKYPAQQGEGGNKRQAEQEAAALLLDYLENPHD